MNKFKFVTSLTRAFYKTGFKLKQHSPELFMILGAGGVVASTVLACKATLKAPEVKKKSDKYIAGIQASAETGKTTDGLVYTPEHAKKDLAMVHANTVAQYVKLYAPSVILGGASLGLMFASNGIMRQRNTALAAAYMAVDSGFKSYRKNVVERFGKELDNELRCNLKTKEIEETVVDGKGKQKKVKKKVQVAEYNPSSDFSRCFDESCVGWTKDPEANKTFLNAQQQWANQRLEREGYLFLNDVYEALGFNKTSAGQIVGWRYRPNDPDHVGDNYIDFGMLDITKEANRRFVNGLERSIWLDFNVDGPIYHLIEN